LALLRYNFLSTLSFKQIIIQAILSLGIVIYTILQVVGDFREIRATVDLQAKTWETLTNIPSFYTFNHRGKSLAPDYIQPSPTAFDKTDLSATD
jgi:membrane magnesium transporter 1